MLGPEKLAACAKIHHAVVLGSPMSQTFAVLMDPIQRIHPEKDTTLALLLEAQRRGHALRYLQQGDLAIRDGAAWARLAPLEVRDSRTDWFTLGDAEWQPLAGNVDVILERKDPPFDTQFLYDTLVLDLAARAGVRVINNPQALRDFNEKLAAQWFPQCCAPALVSRQRDELRRFAREYGKIVLKPLDGMGGHGVFLSAGDDPNLNSILETLAGDDHRFVMAQRYIPEIKQGDKRILVVNGKPVPYALARIPQGTDFRGNLAAGGKGVGQPLSERDRWIAAEVGPELARRGIILAGLDVIGDYLTEVNVTSPTCARELDAQFGLNIAGMVLDVIEQTRAGNAAPATGHA
jgi:glutathione synthase